MFELDETKKEWFSLYDECLSIINGTVEDITEEQRIKYATNQRTKKIGSKQLVYSLVHCSVCKKNHISCGICEDWDSCEFYFRKYDKDVRI